jgi:N6-adenosine-specific RNA methylase IME4
MKKPDTPLEQLAEQINARHEKTLRTSLESARDIGVLLLRAKDECVRSKEPWLAWLGKSVIFNRRTATNYMRVASNWDKIGGSWETVSQMGLVEALNWLAGGGAGEPEAAAPDPFADGCTVDDLHKLVERGLQFGTIYADPPWRLNNQRTRSAAGREYPTMLLEEITALPVPALASDRCHCHLWCLAANVPDALEVLRNWGFTYKTQFVWCKPPPFGVGNYWRCSHEVLLLGVKGSGAPFRDHGLCSWGAFERGKHSAKPEEVRAMVEKASPGPRLEMFGRKAVPGWVVWGNAVERGPFDEAVRRIA